MFVAIAHDTADLDVVVRARTIGECLDKAMQVSTRRGGGRLSIHEAQEGAPYPGATLSTGPAILDVVCNGGGAGGKGLAIISHITELPDRSAPVDEPEAASSEAEA